MVFRCIFVLYAGGTYIQYIHSYHTVILYRIWVYTFVEPGWSQGGYPAVLTIGRQGRDNLPFTPIDYSHSFRNRGWLWWQLSGNEPFSQEQRMNEARTSDTLEQHAFQPQPIYPVIDHDQLNYNIYFIIVLIIRLEVYGSAWDKDISKCDFIT